MDEIKMTNIRTPPEGQQAQQLKKLLQIQTNRPRTGAQKAVKQAAQKKKLQRQRAQKAAKQALSKKNITDVVEKIVQQKVKDAVQQQVKDVVPRAVQQQTAQQVKDVVQQKVAQQVNAVVPKAVQQKTQQQIKDIVALPPALQSVLKKMIQQKNKQQTQMVRKVFQDIVKGVPLDRKKLLFKFHPDRVGPGKEQIFKLINNITSNPDQFKKYIPNVLRILDRVAQVPKLQQISQLAPLTIPKNVQDVVVQQQQSVAVRTKSAQQLQAQKQAARKKICDQLKKQRVLR